MARELTPTELAELLPAYALDAVDEDEREQVEAWLERAPDASAELGALREAAALLALPDVEAPPALWSRIEESLAVEPPRLALPGEATVTPIRSGRRAGARVVAGIAAASAAAAAVTALVVSSNTSDRMTDQQTRLDALAHHLVDDGMRQSATAAMADPRARVIRLAGSGDASATVVTMPDGSGFLMGHRVPRLADDRTYQLWALVGDRAAPMMISAAVMGRGMDVTAFDAPADAFGFAVTVEPRHGAVRPSTTMVFEGTFA